MKQITKEKPIGSSASIPEKMTAKQWIEAYSSALEKQGCSAKTVNIYSKAVSQYFSLYPELTAEQLNSYRSYLIETYQTSTVNTRISGLNRFLSFLYDSKILADYPHRLPRVKEQTKNYMDNVISKRDYEKLKRGLKKDGNLYWYFVVRFLGATGARISELLQIKIEDLKTGYLDLYTKGGKLRRLYFPKILCQEALPYFLGRGIDSGFLFLNQRGKLITARGIEQQLKKLAVRYHIDPDTVYPHSFRHRFAKNFLKRFNDISLLADLMGHDSIETTRLYLTRSSKEQKALLDRMITW